MHNYEKVIHAKSAANYLHNSFIKYKIE